MRSKLFAGSMLSLLLLSSFAARAEEAVKSSQPVAESKVDEASPSRPSPQIPDAKKLLTALNLSLQPKDTSIILCLGDTPCAPKPTC